MLKFRLLQLEIALHFPCCAIRFRSGFKRGPNQQPQQQQQQRQGGNMNYNRGGGGGGGLGGRQPNNDYSRGGGDRYNNDGGDRYNQQGRDGRDYGRDGRGNSSRSAGNNYNGTHFILDFSLVVIVWLMHAIHSDFFQ